jgi:hypothetical protein
VLGAKGDGGKAQLAAEPNAAVRGQVSSKPHLNAADCKSLDRSCLLNFEQCWIFSRDGRARVAPESPKKKASTVSAGLTKTRLKSRDLENGDRA